jgi:hypothetical protein
MTPEKTSKPAAAWLYRPQRDDSRVRARVVMNRAEEERRIAPDLWMVLQELGKPWIRRQIVRPTGGSRRGRARREEGAA